MSETLQKPSSSTLESQFVAPRSSVSALPRTVLGSVADHTGDRTARTDFTDPRAPVPTTSASSEFQIGRSVKRPITAPSVNVVSSSFVLLQDWEGVVEEVSQSTFNARLRDRTVGDEYAAESIELAIDDVSDDDRELLMPGAVFYLGIGRLTRPSGRQDRVTRIVFRRIPRWTRSTLKSAAVRAERRSRFLSSCLE